MSVANMDGPISQVSYPADWSCFGLFGSRPTLPMGIPPTDSACALQISIGEAF